MKYVFATSETVVGWRGRSLVLHPGQAWRDDDPFVVENPSWFTEHPPADKAGQSGMEPIGQPPLERAVTDGGKTRRAR